MSENKVSNLKPKKKKFLNTLSKKLSIIFVAMIILISFSSCIIGYLKYSSTIKQLYNENSYSIANIVQSAVTPEMGDFLESLIVYQTDDDGNFLLDKYGHKIPKLVEVNGALQCEVNLDMYADPATLEGEELEKYNKYYEFLDTIDSIRVSSGAKYIFFSAPFDGDTAGDPYYEEGQEQFANPYCIYFADARMSDETLVENGLSDAEIVEMAKSFGVEITEADVRDKNGQVVDWIYDSFCRLPLGSQSRLDANIYEDAHDVYLTGNKSDNYFETNTEFGLTTEALLPVKNSNGEIFGLVAVDVEMEIIRSTLLSYVLTAILATVALVTLFMLLLLLLLNLNIVNPIKKITRASDKFFEEDMAIDDSVVNIKTGDEIEALATSFHKMSEDLVDYVENLASVTAEKERIGAELDVATHIQASMLPCIFPPYPDREEFDIYATMNPAKEVGGDFYDFFMVDDTHIAIVMADVSGKGVPAALFMVIGKTLIKDHTVPGQDLGQVFSTVNNLLCQSNSEGLFITAFEGVLDLVTGEFRYVNAGHEMPFICKAGGRYEPYKIKAAFVLAGMEGMKYKSGSFFIEPGDRIFEYTDGVTEATNKDNQLYGMDRLERVLCENADKTPDLLLPAVKADIDAFVGEAPQFDDITMLCLDYKKKAVAPNPESEKTEASEN